MYKCLISYNFGFITAQLVGQNTVSKWIIKVYFLLPLLETNIHNEAGWQCAVEELHDLHRSSNIVRFIRFKKLRWEVLVIKWITVKMFLKISGEQSPSRVVAFKSQYRPKLWSLIVRKSCSISFTFTDMKGKICIPYRYSCLHLNSFITILNKGGLKESPCIIHLLKMAKV